MTRNLFHIFSNKVGLKRGKAILISFMGMPEVRAQHHSLLNRVQQLEEDQQSTIQLSDLLKRVEHVEQVLKHWDETLPPSLRHLHRQRNEFQLDIKELKAQLENSKSVTTPSDGEP